MRVCAHVAVTACVHLRGGGSVAMLGWNHRQARKQQSQSFFSFFFFIRAESAESSQGINTHLGCKSTQHKMLLPPPPGLFSCWSAGRLSLRPLCDFLFPLPLPARRPSENLEETVVHPDRQLPLLFRVHDGEYGHGTLKDGGHFL